MRLSRKDLVPVLAIVAGGVIGFSLSLNFLLLSRSDDVPVADPVVAPSVTAELAVQVRHPSGVIVTGASIEFDGMVFTPVVAPSASGEPVRLLESLASTRKLDRDVAAAMDRLVEARREGTLLSLGFQGRRGLTPEEWQTRR